MELLSTALDAVPDLPGNGGSALGADEGVDAGAELGEGVLHVGALGEAGAQEGSVEGDEDPRAALEQNGGEQQADPEEQLEARHDGHGRIIVLLDEDANLVGEGVSRLGLGRGALDGRRGLGGHEGRNDIGARVGGDVEDGVDAVGEQGEGELGREEPDEGEDCVC